jgi:hypothetical protein
VASRDLGICFWVLLVVFCPRERELKEEGSVEGEGEEKDLLQRRGEKES